MDAENRTDSGQVLVLFALMLAVMIVFVVMVIDVGMFMHTRQQAQNVVDAAALAGAQELPDSPANAEAVARDYASRNDYDPNELEITFKCTSGYAQFCDPANGKYDTIVVTAKETAPAFFGPILTVLGAGSSCWTSGCDTQVRAAGCRGMCGAAGAEVDAVVAIDHTGSMKATELQNARDGALALMRVFDYQVHRIGLAVTPPVHTNNLCDTVESWTDADRTWLPVPLTSSFQTSPNVLDNASTLVSTTSCLDLAGSGDVPGPHTDLANPMKAAADELTNNGRPGARKGIVYMTDGAANVYGETPPAGVRGPCDWAYKEATAAKALGYEIYTIGYGVDENCTREDANSPWKDKPVAELLRQMATDDQHFYNQPKTADLDPVFQAIGIQLASGSKLVQ